MQTEKFNPIQLAPLPGEIPLPRGLVKPKEVLQQCFYRGCWVLTLDNGQEVVDPKLEKAERCASRIIAGAFFPMIGRIVDVRV